MKVLVINCGSSSVKMAHIDAKKEQNLFNLKLEKIGSEAPQIQYNGQTQPLKLEKKPYEDLLREAIQTTLDHLGKANIDGIGHRIAHGGDKFEGPTLITDEVENTIRELSELAPLHNPVNLLGVQVLRQMLPEAKHVAVFDTAFHQTLPNRAIHYALPLELAEKHHLRRYGFHGTSHQYVAEKAAAHLNTTDRNLRIITCHLGNGASMAAVEYGRSVETSMGMTPLEGLPMGTRSGDVDPGMLVYLMHKEGLDAEGLNDMLNKQSGLKGLSGISNDMREIEIKASEGDENCRMALQVYSHRIRKYIGSYAAVMGGVDAIVFTGGIGENSEIVRHRASQRLDFLGAVLNEDANRSIHLSEEQPVGEFSESYSRCKLLAIRTDENKAIAQQTAPLIEEKHQVNTDISIPIEVSARHCHLTQETVEKLFGEGYQLTPMKELSQKGQFASEETVKVIGPKRSIDQVRILGPVRDYDQVEISRTDEFHLGIDAPVRASGQTENTPGIRLEGSEGRTVDLPHGVICAWRHIHMSPDEATRLGVSDRDIVDVEVDDQYKGLAFRNVLIRAKPSFSLAMHIDTDEANAAEIDQGATGYLKARHVQS